MARKVFFSFHYQNDVERAMVVRNSGVIRGNTLAGFIDKAEFEEIQRKGDASIKSWIDKQLLDTSVTVVLVGSETLNRRYVKYEIVESYKRGNAIIAVKIDAIKDLKGRTTSSQSLVSIVGYDIKGDILWFDDIIVGEYNYIKEDGYNNLGRWIEKAVRQKGR